MRKIVCIGESILSPLGATPAENFAAVCRGESALERYEGMFGVREPFVASLMDRSLWAAPGQSHSLRCRADMLPLRSGRPP